jgi:hypothetical protein
MCPRTAFSLTVFVVALPLAIGGSDTQCDVARGRLDVLRADLRLAALDVGRWCGPDELVTNHATMHATLLQLNGAFAELRANSALDEEKLAELQSMLMRLVGAATVESAVPRPDLQQPLRKPVGNTVPRIPQANNGTETSGTIDDWQPHTHQDRCRHSPLRTYNECP